MILLKREVTQLVSSLVILLIISCEGPAGPVLSGSLSGYVRLESVEEYPLENRSGVTILIEEPGMETISEDDGSWTIKDLTTGTYTIHFSKDGFSYARVYGYEFVGGGADYFTTETRLYQIPDYSLENLQMVHYDSLSYLDVVASEDAVDLSLKSMMIFIGDEASVTSAHENSLFSAWGSNYYENNDPLLRVRLNNSYFENVGLSSGDTAYVIAYPTTRYPRWDFHPGTREKVYTTLGVPSDVLQFSIPDLWN
ncbi:MAG: hypothetical protein HQ556_15750 [Candidatus Marinimicrobia bacterium]|nr:hypothetical protein [Candidatus Neomarinimicrobiota bacterium]